MNDLDWRARHRIAGLLATHFPDRRRLDALATTAGLSLPPARGFEPLFSAASVLVLGAGEALAPMLAAAAEQNEAFSEFAPEPEVEAEPDEVPTMMVATIEEAPEGVAPRPAGTPAQAPPLDGVETWVARHIEWELPEALAPGESASVVIRFRAPDGGAVGGAPAGHTSYVGESFPVDVELTVQGGTPEHLRQTMRCDPIENASSLTFVLTPAADATELDAVLRCFSGGYEVGRGRLTASLPSGERSSGGALAVPDSVLEQVNEDAIKTVQTH